MSRPLRVLMVEDSEDDAALLLVELRRHGFEPRAERVETAEAMRRALEAGTWDVILSDFRLPHFSGTAALALTRDSAIDVPFIMVSGTVGEEAAVDALHAGAHDFITKEKLSRLCPAIDRSIRDAANRRDLRQSEEALRKSEARFRALIEHGMDSVAILDAHGRITYASPSIMLLGYRPKELEGQVAFDFLHPGDLERVTALLAAALADHTLTLREEYRIRHKDGSWRTFESVVSNLLDNPDIAGFVVNSRDITERTQLQAQFLQAQKMESVGQLAGGIAHDFNNLLAVIAMYSDLVIVDLPAGDQRREDLETIRQTVQSATMLTRRLLSFSRQDVVQPKVLDPNMVISDLAKILRRVIGEKVELVTQLDQAAGPVMADVGQMEQVLMNLAVNARDAMPTGGRLTIATARVELEAASANDVGLLAAGSYAVISVADTGTGMSPDTCARIFQPFFSTKGAKGTGLGLATVYGIIHQSGGQIAVASELGRGTTFTIFLPAISGEGLERHGGALEAEPRGGNETIILAEDDPSVRQAVTSVLARLGYTVVAVGSAADAITTVRDYAGPIHLVISDVVLPGMDGPDLLHELQRIRPEIKAMLVSGYAGDAVSRHRVQESGVPFLEKPFTTARLARRVRDILGVGNP